MISAVRTLLTSKIRCSVLGNAVTIYEHGYLAIRSDCAKECNSQITEVVCLLELNAVHAVIPENVKIRLQQS